MDISNRSSFSFVKFTAIDYTSKIISPTTMTQITIDIPDELAQRLAPFQSQFSDLFTSLIATRLLGQSTIESFTPASTLTVPTVISHQGWTTGSNGGNFLLSAATSSFKAASRSSILVSGMFWTPC
jgi:hypothetical protein